MATAPTDRGPRYVLPCCSSSLPTPPAARAAGHIERFVRVAHSSQPGAADSFCAPTAGDAVLPLS